MVETIANEGLITKGVLYIEENLMKEKNKKADEEFKLLSNVSKKSYETDPPLKELARDVKDKCGSSRRDELENNYPTKKEISLFAKEADNLLELNPEFKTSFKNIATTFHGAIADLQELNNVNFEIKKMIIESFFQTARALAISVEARDPYTGGHSERVFQIATGLGKMCNLNATEQLYLEGGALLHDVGKIGIRDGVLLKPGPLTECEYKEIQQHTIIGAQMVKKLDCLQGCLDVVLLHHERLDGYGYPYGIKAKEIPLIARITSIADAYDAMTSNRIYRKALSHEEAFEEILRCSGTQFDPEIVKIFIKWWEKNFHSGKGKEVRTRSMAERAST